VPSLGHAQRVERLHNGNGQIARGRQRRQPAGPAQRVHHVGPVLAPPLVQRQAEGRHLRQQVRVVAAAGVGLGVGRADVLDADAGRQPRPLRPRRAAAPRVHGHLMAVAGQAPAHLDQAGVVARLLRAVAGYGRGVLCYQGDLH
jgi:hypothetical protein